MDLPMWMVWWAIALYLRIAGAYSNELALAHSIESHGLLPILGRLLGDCDIVNLIVVSDIDGNLHGIDRVQGFIKWTLPMDEPLVQIQTSLNALDSLWMVEPYHDGMLYYFTPTYGLNKIPTLIRELVMASPFSLRDDNKIYTGLRSTKLYEVNVHTGETRPLLGSEQCPVPRTHYKPESWLAHDTFLIGKTTYELTIADKNNSAMVWNVTYSQWGPNNIDNDLILQNRHLADNLYFYPFYDKVLLAFNNREKWGCKLPGIAVLIFDIFHNRNNGEYVMLPHPVSKADNDDDDARDKVFLTKTSNSREWMAMLYANYPSLIKTAEFSPYTMDLLKFHQGYPFDTNRLLKFNISNATAADVENYVTGIHECHLLSAASNYQPHSRFTPNSVVTIDDAKDLWHITTTAGPNIIGGIKFDGDDAVVEPVPTNEMLAPVVEEKPAMAPLLGLLILKRVVEDVIVLLILFVLIMTFGKTSKVFRQVRRAIDGDQRYYQYERSQDPLEDTPLLNGVAQFEKPVVVNEDSNITISEKKVTIDPKVVDDMGGEAEIDEPKKKRKRGNRGGKRGGRRINKQGDVDEEDERPPPLIPSMKRLQVENNLVISDKILGYGSHGTVVYQGMFENRPVAVKRMLLDFYDVASHEVRLLQESDDHENVIRYYCSQTSALEKFLYIALELCRCSLEDIVEKPKQRTQLSNVNLTLYELALGLHHLHSLKIVHRDIKPQNILVSDRKKPVGDEPSMRLLISDFGLCKKLDSDQLSFRATTQHAALGTLGWRAPELLLNHDLLEILPDTISSIGSVTAPELEDVPTLRGKRLTKAIDIFLLGCVFFYILTGGSHPYGDRYLREANIVNGIYDISKLEKTCREDRFEAEDLIKLMVHHDFRRRPNTSEILAHPLFWAIDRRIQFLLAVSDRFDLEKRDPPSPLLQELENRAGEVIGDGWHDMFDLLFLSHLGKHRKYHSHRLLDLLRAIRNKYHHFSEMPPQLQRQMTKPDKFYRYFFTKFPNLLMVCYLVVACADNGKLKTEDVFGEYFTKNERH